MMMAWPHQKVWGLIPTAGHVSKYHADSELHAAPVHQAVYWVHDGTKNAELKECVCVPVVHLNSVLNVGYLAYKYAGMH